MPALIASNKTIQERERETKIKNEEIDILGFCASPMQLIVCMWLGEGGGEGVNLTPPPSANHNIT